MKLPQLLEQIRSLVPESLAEPWDQVGLHVEGKANVTRALLCIDLTMPVLEEAIEKKVELVVAYHPPIFSPLTRLTSADVKQSIVLKAAEKGISVYSPHTALDAVVGGVNDFLTEVAMGGDDAEVEPIKVAGTKGGATKVKLVMFVPMDAADRLRDAMAKAGAGQIGNYGCCSFNAPGFGTFKGSAKTNPTVGKVGRFERVDELRMEMLVPSDRLVAVVEVLRTHHPYEEPAFDLYPLLEEPGVMDSETKLSGSEGDGQGRLVRFVKPVSLKVLTERFKKALGLKCLEVAPAEGVAMGQKSVRTLGICAGAGGSLLSDCNVDAFFTGEMRHHDTLAAVSEGTSILLAGHTRTERPYLKTYRKNLRKVADGVDWVISKKDRSPGEFL
ncbi:Nif3-like dinuclear metal center hexameric protein [Poriferisphaera sp. WC338]|uniref:Nif3-like dinuclear metal center hexameric protein n=1 Tax=Poriferisphaera sp. WC338 TaxID=3425129 RepID=UPI003D81BC46